MAVNKVESLKIGDFFASTSPRRDPDHVSFEQEHEGDDTTFMDLNIAQAEALIEWLRKALPDNQTPKDQP
jgi:hypothetical protein